MAPAKLRAISGIPPVRAPQVRHTRASIANKIARMSPEARRILTEECRVRGCVQAAKENGLAVSVCLELRIQDLERTLRNVQTWLAEQQRRAA